MKLSDLKNIRKSVWITGISLALVSFIILALSRRSIGFSDWLCFNVYPIFSGIGSRLWGIFPFSVAEFFVVFFILGALAGAVCLVIRVKRKRGKRLITFINGFSWAVLASAIIFFIVTLNCLVNYNRTPFSEYSGLKVRTYGAGELRELTVFLIEQVNKAAEEVVLDEEGRAVKPSDFGTHAVEAMESLAEKYDVLDAYYPQPKGVVCSDLMSCLNIAGIYFPVTVEANYNCAMPVSSQGFTACHELSHLSGFIREDEANFIAYLACRGSEDPYFRYSGYLEALTYSLNAYYTVADREDYSRLCSMLSQTVLDEYACRSEYWAPYRKKAVYQVSTAVNDAYLKANNQTDGTGSYGRVVNLMLAEYLDGSE